jgi:hypothetical protein
MKNSLCKYIIQTSRSKWQPYNISVPLDLKVTQKSISNTVWFNFQKCRKSYGFGKYCLLGYTAITLLALYIIQTSRSKWQPYNISVPLDLKVTKDTRLILNIIYVWKLNQTVLELDFWAVKFLFSRLDTCLVYISRFSLRDKVTLRSLKFHCYGADVVEWSRALDIRYIYIYIWKLNQTVLELDF